MPRSTLLIASLATALGGLNSALAQDSEEFVLSSYGDADNKKLYEYDTSVPAAPALGMVQNAPELSFTAPFGPDFTREIVYTEKPGAALAARPYWALGFGKGETPETYHDRSALFHILARTVFSTAVAQRVVEDQKGLGLGAGLSTELLESGDPRLYDYHLGCLADTNARLGQKVIDLRRRLSRDPALLAEAKTIALQMPGLPAADIHSAQEVEDVITLAGLSNDDRLSTWWRAKRTPLNAAAEEHLKGEVGRCFKRAKLAAENLPSLQVAIGASWAGDDYSLSRLKSQGVNAWAGFRLPLGIRADCFDTHKKTERLSFEPKSRGEDGVCVSPTATLTAFAHYVGDDQVDVGGTQREAESSQLGLVLNHTAPSRNWTLSASAAWNRRDYKARGLPTDDFERYSVAFAHKVSGSMWVEATFGQTTGIVTAKDESYGLVRFVFK